MISLSLELKVPLHELYEYPQDILDEYRAYNIIAPFGHDMKNYLLGAQMAMSVNKDLPKKDRITASDLFPFMAQYPKNIEDKLISTASRLLEHKTGKYLLQALEEEIYPRIEFELKQDEIDEYRVRRLASIYRTKKQQAEDQIAMEDVEETVVEDKPTKKSNWSGNKKKEAE